MIGSTSSTSVQSTITSAVQQGGAAEKANTPQQQPLAKTAQPRQAASAETQDSNNQKRLSDDDKGQLEGFARKNASDESASASSRPGQILDISV